MIPLDQTINGDGKNGNPVGNCWQACVASLLDLPLDQVPHFALESGEDWYRDTSLFVIKHTGFELACFVPGFPHTKTGGYVIGSGLSPRGAFNHSVILDGFTGELVHDPHISRAGLSGPVIDVFGFTRMIE